MAPWFWLSDSVRVSSYLTMFLAGYLAASLTVLVLARRVGLPRSHALILTSLGCLVGLAGAWGLQALASLGQTLTSSESAVRIPTGRAYLGGPLLVFPFVLCYCRWLGLPFFRVLDVLAPGLVIGSMFGRIGCFLAGCCHGSPTDSFLGVYFTGRSVPAALRGLPLHPTQLYESAGLLLLFVGLLLWWRRRTGDGQIILGYFLFYPLIRFPIEFFRGDSIRGFVFDGWLTTSQLTSLGIFLVALIALGAHWVHARRAREQSKPKVLVGPASRAA